MAVYTEHWRPVAAIRHTLDARHTQAVQAFPPASGTHSFYTQHTINFGTAPNTRACVRWYQIDPGPTPPVVQRSGNICSVVGTDTFNAAISPDRRRGVATGFGNSFVINYNVSSRPLGIFPGIVVNSSLNGGGLTLNLVKAGVAPYRDFSCPNPGDQCRWGDYAAATPDPNANPNGGSRGVVWGTNQFSGLANPPAGGANFRTQIFAHQP